MICLLRRLSLHHPRRASLAADWLQAICHAAGSAAEVLGDACFAAEQALREHDRDHQARRAKAQAGLTAFIVAMRAANHKDHTRWN